MNSTHVFKSYNLPDFQVGKPKIIRHDIFSWLNLIRERGSFPTLPVGHFCVCYSRCTYRDDGGGGGVTVYLIRHLETTAMLCTMPFNGREKIPKWSVFTSSEERLLKRGRRATNKITLLLLHGRYQNYRFFQKIQGQNNIVTVLCQDLSKLVSLSTEASIHSNAKGYALKHQRQDPGMISNSNSQLLLMRWSGHHVNFLQTIGITCQMHESSQIFLPNILG